MSLIHVPSETVWFTKLPSILFTVFAVFSWIFAELLRKLLFRGVRVVEVGIPVLMCVLAFIAQWQVVGQELMKIGSGNTNWLTAY